MSWLVHGVRFACEITAVVAVVWWGWPVLGIVLGIAVIAVWGAWVAPKAKWRLADPARIALEIVIFGGATGAFASMDKTLLANVFGVAAAVTVVLARRFPAP